MLADKTLDNANNCLHRMAVKKRRPQVSQNVAEIGRRTTVPSTQAVLENPIKRPKFDARNAVSSLLVKSYPFFGT